ncbi:hypothetical protein WG66_006650 [Moniliophthora roreri]|nr:hypothetical protein WG66_006650 [Moniliophthora roreri]
MVAIQETCDACSLYHYLFVGKTVHVRYRKYQVT